jgi:glycosyltransferase involved in cell wall biosynthesis
MMDFTVAIPTFNGAQRITKVLDQLRQQEHIENLKWTVIVVDNNSTDNTADIINSYRRQQASLPYQLTYAQEARQGAAFARHKAMQIAESEWVGFLDDDILPDPKWIFSALEFISKQVSRIAVFGGQIHGSFETNPPPNFHRIQSFLAIRERGDIAHRYDPDLLVLPPSAAWVVHRRAWLSTVPPIPVLRGRTQGSMTQGDDYEPLLYLHRAGWEIWYNPTMHVSHEIPSWRLERDYLIALSQGCGRCICRLRMINTSNWQRPIAFTKITLGSFKRLIQHWLKYRDQIHTDLVSLCESKFFLSSFLSSFYYLGGQFQSRKPYTQNSEFTEKPRMLF